MTPTDLSEARELLRAGAHFYAVADRFDLAPDDLAAHMDKPLGTVKGWIRRGMAHLRGCLESRMGAAS